MAGLFGGLDNSVAFVTKVPKIIGQCTESSGFVGMDSALDGGTFLHAFYSQP